MQDKKQHHPLIIVFFAFALVVLGGSCIYAMLTHPVRKMIHMEVLAEERQQATYERAVRLHLRATKPPGAFQRMTNRFRMATPYVWPDFALAALIYSLWLLCLYFYLRRFVAWLTMERSGEMSDLRSRGLESKVLGANAGRKDARV